MLGNFSFIRFTFLYESILTNKYLIKLMFFFKIILILLVVNFRRIPIMFKLMLIFILHFWYIFNVISRNIFFFEVGYLFIFNIIVSYLSFIVLLIFFTFILWRFELGNDHFFKINPYLFTHLIFFSLLFFCLTLWLKIYFILFLLSIR